MDGLCAPSDLVRAEPRPLEAGRAISARISATPWSGV